MAVSPTLGIGVSLWPNKSALLRLSHIFFQFGSREETRAAARPLSLSFDIWGFIWQHHAPMGARRGSRPPPPPPFRSLQWQLPISERERDREKGENVHFQADL